MTPQEHADQVDRVHQSVLADHMRLTLHDVYPARRPRPELVPGAAAAAAIAVVLARPEVPYGR